MRIPNVTRKNIKRIIDGKEETYMINKSYTLRGEVVGCNSIELNKELREKNTKLKKELKELQNTNKILNENIVIKNNTIKDKENEISKLSEELREKDITIKEIKINESSLNKTITQLQNYQIQNNSNNSELIEQNMRLLNEVGKLKHIIQKLNEEIETFKKTIIDKENQYAINIEKLNEKLKNQEDVIKKLSKDIRGKNASIKELNEIIIIYEKKLKKLKKNTMVKDHKNNEEIIKLMKEMKKKEKEMKEKEKEMNEYEDTLLDQLMSVIFVSDDQKILSSIICKKTDTFSKVEESLYKRFPEYKSNKNYFLFNGSKITRFNTIEENKIKDNEIIYLTNDGDM